ncbi:CMRF35-like molecule 7 [Malurus melanocephalus]|uniref:CMRF35-like molecule 7 n=1 Tax=Malurus melanocephalus TaxID=175006 RepID=UPI0025499A4A|nr:CMRF35-like molecule 7 [Malurus melanocephalus]
MQLLPLLAWALLPGCGAVTGPGTVRGFLAGIISVISCRPGQETKLKLRRKRDNFLLCCWHHGHLGLAPVAQRGRFSTRDKRAQRAFTATVERLSQEDTGSFLCGCEREFTALVTMLL